jgi:16S rRNA (uracil1498-N3)-methyltransferase
MSVRGFLPADHVGLVEPGASVELDDEESRYLLKVRRLRPGDPVELYDGVGRGWTAQLEPSAGRRARLRLGPALDLPEPPTRVLLLGLPDQPATLEALTGASELGATRVVLVRCARSQGRVPSPERIARVLRAAQRQCGRLRPLEVLGLDEPLELPAALELDPQLPGWFAWEALREPTSAPASASDPGSGTRETATHASSTGLRLLVGPEGGWTPTEVEAILAAGWSPLGLGPWVLRTPTAVVALLARFVSPANG